MTKKSVAFVVILTFFAAAIFFSKNILNADQGVYEQKCSKCHSLRKPEIYTKKEWKYNVERMAKRAGLTSDEIESIINLHPK